MLTGSLVAIATPMLDDGRLDFARFRDLIDFHVAEGTDGIVVVGTTGESPTVNFDEHKELIRRAVEFAGGRVPVIAGTGANATAEAVELTESAKSAGAAACLSVVPYYNKPSQEGLYQHFSAVAQVSIPTILYNVPGRTVADIANDTVLRLAALPNIVGIKDATANMERCSDLLRRAPKDFAVYSGDDASALALLLLGGHGVISAVRRGTVRRGSSSARNQQSSAAFASEAVCRSQPHTGEVGHGADGSHRSRAAPAHDAACGPVP